MVRKPAMIDPENPEALHFVPPSARELRAQAVHRLQIGLLGVASMLLLIGLANIIMDRARQSDGQTTVGNPPSAEKSNPTQSDPLADIGVVPSPEASAVSPVDDLPKGQ